MTKNRTVWIKPDTYKELTGLRADLSKSLGSAREATYDKVIKNLLESRKRDYPRVIRLVGSVKPTWRSRYRMVEELLTLAGYVVLTVTWFKDQLVPFETYRNLFAEIGFQQIRMSDAVVLIQREAMGPHTAIELQFAESIGKPTFSFEGEETIKQLGEALK